MKNRLLLCLFMAALGLQSCKQKETAKEVKAELGPPTAVQCYQSIYENDTIHIKLNTYNKGQVTGDMVMKVANMPEKIGELTGEFHGDTIFADYSFYEGDNEKKKFKNPMAFLKKDEQLILGNGSIQITMGVSYLNKDVPIDFDRVKYKFNAVDCIAK